MGENRRDRTIHVRPGARSLPGEKAGAGIVRNSWLRRGGRRGEGLTNPKGLPLYRRAKIGKPNRLEVSAGSGVVVSVGVTNFP